MCDMVVRPGFGDMGRPVRLSANAFGIKLPNFDVHQYDVDIKESAPPARNETPPITLGS